MVAPIAMPPQATPSTLAAVTSLPCVTIPLFAMPSSPPDFLITIIIHTTNSLAIGSTIFLDSYIVMLNISE